MFNFSSKIPFKANSLKYKLENQFKINNLFVKKLLRNTIFLTNFASDNTPTAQIMCRDISLY